MTSDAAPGYLSADDCRLADLIDLVSQKTDLTDYPYAAAVEQNTLIYDGARLRKELSRPAGRPRLEAELANVGSADCLRKAGFQPPNPGPDWEGVVCYCRFRHPVTPTEQSCPASH